MSSGPKAPASPAQGFRQPPPTASQASGPPPTAAVPTMPPARRRRQPAWIALGVVLVILGALGAVYLINSLTDRVDYVGVGRPVAIGQLVQQADLVEVQLPEDQHLKPVLWSNVDSVVGKRATTDLRAGSLLTADSVADAQVPPQGQALVGVPVKNNQAPGTPLKPRDEVLLVPYAGTSTSDGQTATGGTADTATVSAQVYTVGEADANGVTVVDVLVPEAQGAALAQKAAAGQVAIVLISQR